VRYAAIVLLCALAFGTWAESKDGTNAPPTVAALLDRVLAQMPEEPIRIAGRLAVRDRAQRAIRSYDVDIQFHATGDAVYGAYTLFDKLGARLEQFKVERRAGKIPLYRYFRGDPPKEAPVPDVSSAVRDTGITWSDLALPFLWWRDGSVVGSESVRGRDCYVVDLNPQPGELKRPVVVRAWIDKDYHMFLKAEEYGPGGQKLRRLLVQSFKKIENEWMVKDIVVDGTTNLPSGYKTVLIIDDMRPLRDPGGTNAPVSTGSSPR